MRCEDSEWGIVLLNKVRTKGFGSRPRAMVSFCSKGRKDREGPALCWDGKYMWKRRVEVRVSESSLCERPDPDLEETVEAWAPKHWKRFKG